MVVGLCLLKIIYDLGLWIITSVFRPVSRLSHARWSWGAAPAPRGLTLGSMDFGDTAFSPPVPACCFPSLRPFLSR